MTSRERMYHTLEFCNYTGRAPQNLWTLPWTETNHPKQLQRIRKEFPSDIDDCRGVAYSQRAKTQGDPFAPGLYIDEWGCRFQNVHPGIIGEVKEPIVSEEDEEWEDTTQIHIPVEELTFDPDTANAYCKGSDCFILAGCALRPFERLQFIRGTEQLYMDLVTQPKGMLRFIDRLHAFYCEQAERWCKTQVDAVVIYDDWGAQNSMLISPATWRQLFKPLYKAYAEIAHGHGKKILMHSDGYIADIYPDLIEIGIDAVNSQLFCMGIDKLKPYSGQITFWGEIDRQHLLPNGTLEQIHQAVALVRENLWHNGGCIAQCEFGPGANPENVYQVFHSWQDLAK